MNKQTMRCANHRHSAVGECTHSWPVVTLVVSVASVICCCCCWLLLPAGPADAWATAAQFDRAAVFEGGQWWRLITCHLSHWSLDHLVWDLAVFVILGTILEMQNRRRYYVTLLISAIVIPLAVWWLRPDLGTYRGLSGIDSALFVLLALPMLCPATNTRNTQPMQWPIARWILPVLSGMALVLFLGKCGYEAVAGTTLFVDSVSSGFIPSPESHIAGAVAAGAVVLLIRTSVRVPERPLHIAARRGVDRSIEAV
ncbi:MAG: rhombosortase [Planctomycetes bacterium]|nr:rhombosortase [Planctomycetota bacterium]